MVSCHHHGQHRLGDAPVCFGDRGDPAKPFSAEVPTALIIAILFAIGLGVNVLYQSEGKGAATFDLIIKIMVAIIVLSFFAVVVTLTVSGRLDWGAVFRGYIPDVSFLFKPAAGYQELISSSSNPGFWENLISSQQKDRIIAAFGTAVGINMTFLLPYTLLRKKWGRAHRGLSITDLSVGLFIPFFLATSCVVIAAAASFHLQTADLIPGAGSKTLEKLPAVELAIKEYVVANPENEAGLAAFTSAQIAGLPESDRLLSDMLVSRDANSLAITLEPFAGPTIAQKVFGIGVLRHGDLDHYHFDANERNCVSGGIFGPRSSTFTPRPGGPFQ